jgi:uncharacterized membrane protein YqiK
MLFWQVPAPNEAMLISGSKRQVQDTQFRIVTGHGSFVLPVKQKARMLSLSLREAEITEDCASMCAPSRCSRWATTRCPSPTRPAAS